MYIYIAFTVQIKIVESEGARFFECSDAVRQPKDFYQQVPGNCADAAPPRG